MIPFGATGDRPGVPGAGHTRYNTTLDTLEFYNVTATAWQIAGNTETNGIGGLTTTGVVVRTGTGTYTTRTIAGTANQITLTNGDGVAAAPTVSVPSTFIAPGTVQATGSFIAATATNSYTSTTGTAITLHPGAAATATSVGNTLTLTGGAGGGTSGAGGALTLNGGVPTSGAGGAITIAAAAGVGGNNVGGNLSLTSGNSVGSGTGSTVTVTSGAGGSTGVGGAISITSGAGGSTSGSSGAITILTGTVTSGTPGTLTLQTSNATGTNQNGSNVIVTAGTGTGNGTNGYVDMSATINSLLLPTGTTAQRPGTATAGMIRHNTSTNIPEIFHSSEWVEIGMDGARGFGMLWDDFIKDVLNGTTWEVTLSGTGATVDSVSTGVNSTDSALGVMQLETGTTTTGRAAVGSSNVGLAFGFGYHYLEMRVMFPTLSTAAQEYDGYAGFMDMFGASGNGTDGAYFHYDRNNSTNWRIRVIGGGTSSVTSTSTAVTAGQWYRLGIEVNAAGTTVDFYINGVNVGQHTGGNIPTAGEFFGLGWKIEKQAGTTNRTMLVDYIKYAYRLTNART